MSIKPIGERVLIEPKTEEKTKGGIYIPTGTDDSTNEGVVVEVGQTKEEMPVKKGDKVIYEPGSSTDITIDGKKHIIIRLKDIIAVIN